MECQYCNKEFPTKKSLKNHQTRAQYCLKLQGKKAEADIILQNNKCSKCNTNFSTKSNLKNHERLCAPVTRIANTINNNNNINITNIINIYGSTLSKITTEEIQRKLIPLLMQVVPDLSEMYKVAASGFINEKNNPLVAVTDASRNRLIMRYDDEDKIDLAGTKTCSIVKPPMIEASMNVGTPAAINIAKDIRNKTNKNLIDNISRFLPLSLDVANISLDEATQMKKCEEYSKSVNKRLDEALEAMNQKTYDDFLCQFKSISSAKKLYMNMTNGFVLQMINLEEYHIEWKRSLSNNSGKNLDLDIADLKILCDNGMRRHIDPRYSLQLEKIPEESFFRGSLTSL